MNIEVKSCWGKRCEIKPRELTKSEKIRELEISIHDMIVETAVLRHQPRKNAKYIKQNEEIIASMRERLEAIKAA